MNKLTMLANIQRKISKATGLYHYQWKKRPCGIYSFNYHRIGNSNETAFDPNVFSCDEELFEQQIAFYQKNFDVLNATELNEILAKNQQKKGKYAFLTFDDGYIDNFNIAYPILKAAHCPATMFIATDFIDKTIIPWWDEIAWLIKNNNANLLNSLELPSALPNNINSMTEQQKIKSLLRVFKDNKIESLDTKLNYLRSKAEVQLDINKLKTKIFMDWAMIREMSDNNIDIGSQTCSHQILSHLTTTEQHDEIFRSKQILEQQINKEVRAFAYPVGGEDAFTKITQQLVEKAGYEFAMSFIPAINTSFDNKFNLCRFSIDNQCSIANLKMNISLANTW